MRRKSAKMVLRGAMIFFSFFLLDVFSNGVRKAVNSFIFRKKELGCAGPGTSIHYTIRMN